LKTLNDRELKLEAVQCDQIEENVANCLAMFIVHVLKTSLERVVAVAVTTANEQHRASQLEQ
jgi:hypothetical protein